MTEPVTVKIMPEDTGAMLARTLLVFTITVVTGVAVIWVQRKASAPDFFPTAKMKALDMAAKYATSREAYWHGVAGKAVDLYAECRP